MTHSITTRPQDYDALLKFNDIVSTENTAQGNWIDLTDNDTVSPVSAGSNFGWVDVVEFDTNTNSITAQNTDSAWTDVVASANDSDTNAAIGYSPGLSDPVEDLI